MTQEEINISQKAHIYAYSPGGPRGQGPYAESLKLSNSLENLMMLCHSCHTTVDEQNKAGEQRYSAEKMIRWKVEHEARIERLSGLDSDRASHAVYYQAPIGDHRVLCDRADCFNAMFERERFPTREKPIDLSMISSESKDGEQRFWGLEQENLRLRFERLIQIDLERDSVRHFSIFAVAPQPLLIYLGSLITDKYQASTHQLRREPATWCWPDSSNDSSFEPELITPDVESNTPVLALSISAEVDHARIHKVLGEGVSIWEITHMNHNSNCISSPEDLFRFMECARDAVQAIARVHGDANVHVFPAMPVSCAVELGRIRMPKADMQWHVYDQHIALEGFGFALTI